MEFKDLTKFSDPLYHLDDHFQDEVTRILSRGATEQDREYLGKLFALVHIVSCLDYVGQYIEELSCSLSEIVVWLRGSSHD